MSIMIDLIVKLLGNIAILGYLAYLLPFRFRNKLLLGIPLLILFMPDILWNYLQLGSSLILLTNTVPFLIVLCFFKNYKAGIFYFLIYQVTTMFADSIVFILVSLFLNLQARDIGDMPEYYTPICATLMVVLITVLLFFYAKRFKALQGYDVPKAYWFYFSAIPLCSVYMMFHCLAQYQKSPKTGPETLVAITVLLAINFINLYTYSDAIKHYATRLANQSLMEQVNSFAQKQNSLVEAHKNLRTIRHSIKNDLIPVITAIDEKQYAIADERLREIIGEVDTDLFVSRTGIGFIDDMINYKASIASKSGIDFKVMSKLDAVLKLDYLDVSSIIGTALDNAIEACTHVTGAKTVDISVMSQAKLFMMKISNPRNNDIHPDGAGGFLSTKPDGSEHGFGLTGIKKLVEKNSGELRIEYPENKFEISIVFHGR